MNRNRNIWHVRYLVYDVKGCNRCSWQGCSEFWRSLLAGSGAGLENRPPGGEWKWRLRTGGAEPRGTQTLWPGSDLETVTSFPHHPGVTWGGCSHNATPWGFSQDLGFGTGWCGPTFGQRVMEKLRPGGVLFQVQPQKRVWQGSGGKLSNHLGVPTPAWNRKILWGPQGPEKGLFLPSEGSSSGIRLALGGLSLKPCFLNLALPLSLGHVTVRS